MKATWSEEVYRKFLGIVQSSKEGPLTMEMGEDEITLKLAGEVRLKIPEEQFLTATAHELMALAHLDIDPGAGKMTLL